jgi:uncharacterized protein
MDTEIGQRLKITRGRLLTATAIGVLIIAVDFVLIYWDYYYTSIQGRGAIAVIGLAAYIRLVDGHLPAIGLRITPIQGWWYWCRIAFYLGSIILALMILVGAIWILIGAELPKPHTIKPDAIIPSFFRMCVFTPVLEETKYRLILCVPLAVLLGPWLTVVVGGIIFGALHFAYDNPGLDNMLAGFILTWSFLKSGSLAIPVILHSLGNLFILGMSIGSWYLLNG